MFESAELGHTAPKDEYEREEPKLREALLNVQYDVGQAKRFPVLVIIGGGEGTGKSETVHVLNEWMYPRHIDTHGFELPTQEELERPPMWRFWRALPPKGKVGIFYGSWYTHPILNRAMGRTDKADLERAVAEIRHLERMLHNEGLLILKFWFHLSKDRARKRMRELESDRRTRWRVTEIDRRYFKIYDDFRAVSEHVLRETSTGEAPWVVVEGADWRYRNLTVGRVLLQAMRERLGAAEVQPRVTAAPVTAAAVDNVKLLRDVDLTRRIDKEKYGEALGKQQGRLNRLVRHKRFAARSLVLVFEGWDGAGKGGAIRRVTASMDARHYSVVSIAAPTDEERAQPYLWRFWRHVPGHRGVVIFDRSWYGRVLVERVEGLCSQSDWMRAYDEINEFEEQLLRNGAILCKFWLHVSKDEQLRRFKLREATAFKRFKITPEDWRNRKKWGQYEAAVADTIDRTSTEIAPWTIVEAEDKFYARVKVLRTVVKTLEDAL